MAAKFVSPFISGETEDEVADEGELTIPDAALFNDSLDEGIDPTALLDDADLPVECAAAEPKPAGKLELNDSLNADDDLDETQLPAGDDDPTQAVVEMEPTTLGVARQKTVTIPPSRADEQSKVSPREANSVEKKAEAESLEGQIVAGSASTVESQASKCAPKVKPSFGKKKKGFTPPKPATTKAATTTNQSESKQLPKKISDQSSSNASEKSSPPQNSNPEIGADSPKQQPKGSDVKTTSEKVPPTETKKAKVADKKMIAEEKKREKEKKEQEKALKKQAAEQKKLERGKKKAELERQRNEKRLELERKKAEREQKKMEKELKKIEREQKKAEKQAKTGQKQLTKEKKTGEETSSSDKVEPSSEKVVEERSQQESKVGKRDKTDTMMKFGESNIGEKENTPPNEEQSCKISTKDAAATPSPTASCGADKPMIQKVTLEKGDGQQNTNAKEEELVEAESDDDASEHEELTKDSTATASPSSKSNGKETTKRIFSTPEKGSDEQKICDSTVEEEGKISPKEPGSSEASEQHKEDENTITAASPLVNKSTEVSKDKITKQKEKKVKKFSPPKKAKKDASKAIGKEVKKQRKAVTKMDRAGSLSGAGDSVEQRKAQVGGKGKKRKPSVYSDSEDELEPKRAKPAENVGSVWVQCDNANCKKWRLLRDCDDPGKVLGKWVCSMNTDPDRNSCSAEEERWSDLGDSQEFVESPFIPGSLVWSKMEGYPWWPAMIEEDPIKETYYEMGYRDTHIPVRYHVVFFDIPVSRGWVPSLHTLPYTGHNDPNKDGNVNVPQRFKRTLTDGKKQATKALGLSLKERLETLSFAKRFHSHRRKRRVEESPEAVPSQAKYRKTTSNGERKSARLRVTVEDGEGLEGAMPVVSLKPLRQDQQPDSKSEEVVSDNIKESCDDDSSSLQQHEE